MMTVLQDLIQAEEADAVVVAKEAEFSNAKTEFCAIKPKQLLSYLMKTLNRLLVVQVDRFYRERGY